MAFEAASPVVRAAIRAGAYDILSAAMSRGASRAALIDVLMRRFGKVPSSGFTSQVAAALVNRWEAVLHAGDLLSARTTNRPMADEDHIGTPGLSEKYQYTVVIDFFNNGTGTSFTRPFTINSDVPLGRFDLLNLARTDALELIKSGTQSPKRGDASQWNMTGGMRITEVLKAI